MATTMRLSVWISDQGVMPLEQYDGTKGHRSLTDVLKLGSLNL